MLNKRGAAHFEMIISFIFFIAFVSFLLLVLKPYDTAIVSESVVEGLTISFEEIAGTTLAEVFLRANVTTAIGGSCAGIAIEDRIFEHNLTNSHVTDISGNKIDSSLEYNGAGSGSSLLGVEIDSKPIMYLKASFSPEFPDDNSLVTCTEADEYSFGPQIERDIISYSKLEELKTSYYSQYFILKDEMNVPEIIDFSIVFEDFPEFDMEDFVPGTGDIVARSELFEILDEDGLIKNTMITFKTWE